MSKTAEARHECGLPSIMHIRPERNLLEKYKTNIPSRIKCGFYVIKCKTGSRRTLQAY